MNSSKRQALWTAAGCVAGYALWRAAVARHRWFPFENRVVMITGGSRGLGLVLARELANEGARLAICARDDAELRRACDELRREGASVVGHACDMTRAEDVARFCSKVREELGHIEVLINNAGVIQVGPFEMQTRDDFEEAMDIHFRAALYTIEAVLPDMRRRGEGRIVNVVSVGGEIGVPHLVPYCASKFALAGLSESVRSELVREGIYVTTVFPGLMRTGSPRNAWFKGKHRKEYAWFSISDSMPLLSMSAEKAARQIIHACRRGRAKLTLSVPANLAVYANTLAPELTADLTAFVARRLPSPGGIGRDKMLGSQSTSAWSPSVLTTLTERAAVRNNEVRQD